MPVPTLVRVPTSDPTDIICHVALGSTYSACVSSRGELFTWGFGTAGNLGHGDRCHRNAPTLVRMPAPYPAFQWVACTVGQINPVTEHNDLQGKESCHTLAITADGAAYSFGTCHKGMLGNLSKKTLFAPHDELTPYRIGSPCRDVPSTQGYLSGQQCVAAVSASIHSAILTAQGDVYVFGCGSGGRLGIKKYMEGLTNSRSRNKCYVSKPTAIEYFVEKGIAVRQLSGTRRCMAAIGNVTQEKLHMSASTMAEAAAGQQAAEADNDVEDSGGELSPHEEEA